MFHPDDGPAGWPPEPGEGAALRRYQDLVRLSPDAILVNRADRIEFANPASAELFGVASPEELIGTSPFEWFHPSEHARIQERIQLMLAGAPLVPRDTFTVVRRDGTSRRAESVAARLTDERGPALQVMLRDVTERERAEAALREAHQRVTDVLESIGDAFYAVDARWRLTYVNRRTEGHWRRAREELLGRDLWELFPSFRDTEGATALQRAMRERRPTHFETFSPFLGIWIEAAAYPAADGGLSVFFQDVTARKRAEAALRESEARLRELAEALPQLVWTADASGRADWFNGRWRDYTGQAPGAEAWEPALHPEDAARIRATWAAAQEHGSAFEMEHRLRRADGQYRWFLRRAFPLREAEGQPARWFGTCTDIHDLKLSQEVLHRASRLKEDFIDMASHELRTPLTTLRLQLDLLERVAGGPAPDAARLERHLAVARAQVARLQALVGMTLDVSRIHAGRLVLDLADLDLAELAREVAERLQPEAEAAGVALRLGGGSAVGRWDRARLDLVVTNLVGNAVKYGAGRPVDLEVEARGDTAVLRVRDRGPGIAPERQERVFERFERAVDGGAVPGLGLGLWIARAMVEAHGGRISVASAPGEGSTFTVELPRRRGPG